MNKASENNSKAVHQKTRQKAPLKFNILIQNILYHMFCVISREKTAKHVKKVTFMQFDNTLSIKTCSKAALSL